LENKVTNAKILAKKKHKHQFRKDKKTRYWKHLEQVVKRLEKLGIKDHEILCAGWLHDTIEDTDTDYDDIKKNFGKKVADIVSSVTKDTVSKFRKFSHKRSIFLFPKRFKANNLLSV